jgi:hypothetical protein
VPAVAPSSTGLPTSASLSRTSKNVLNSPLKDAEKIGVTAISPSAPVTVSRELRRASFGKPVTRLSARSRACSRSSITSTVASSPRAFNASTVAAVSRSASSRVEDGLLRPPLTTAIVRVVPVWAAIRPRPPHGTGR